MFTPQKLWALTPRSEGGRNNGSISAQGSGLNHNSKSPSNGDVLTTGKAKALALFEKDGNMDQESLTERVAKLENELFDYQYNMGLLLIEKKEWSLKCEELRQALADTTDSLKKEEASNFGAISELEKREENLKKALGVERQCVIDLEKALREMRSEYSEIKYNADSKLAEANLLVTSVEEKSLEVEAKIHATDAKLAEVSRKSSEIERKMHEIEAQENALRRERTFFNTERKTHDTSISKQKEDVREWERKLQEAEERLADSRRFLNQREERANDRDKSLKDRQDDLEEFQKKIEMDNLALKNKEDDMSRRLASIALKEKEADGLRKSLEAKEKQLVELEEKLNAREKMEIQKLLDEHERNLAEKKQEFELEIEEKRKLHEEQLKNKVVEVEKREAEIAHTEEKVKKREQAIEKKLEKLREKEVDYDSKSKALKEREKSLKVEEKTVANEKKRLLAEEEEILGLKAELEKLKSDTEKEQQRLIEETEQLKLTKEERSELERMKSELKQEIEKYGSKSELLVKETDDLKQERVKFEKEWEDLDEKRAEIKKEQEAVLDQRNHLEKFRQTEEERLHKEKLETQEYVQRELEALKLAKDSFAASMEHEKSMFAENFLSEKSQLLHDFELRKQEMETEMQKRQEEMDARLHEREKSFSEEKERELNNINYLREVARREMEEMKLERRGIEKEKLEISENKKHVESQRSEMKNDIEELVALSQKLKGQREQFIRERERFIAFAEKQKNCNVCGEIIREFMLSDLHPLAAVNNLEAPPLPRVAENYMNQAVVKDTSERFNDESSPVVFDIGSPTGGTISWLRKCTSKIFKLSPGKKLVLDSALDQAAEASGKQADVSLRENEPESSVRVAKDSLDVQIIESESGIREDEAVQALSVDQGSQGIPENSENSNLGKRRGGRRVSRPNAVRARTVKNVVTVSKTVVELSPGDHQNPAYANGNAESSAHLNEESKTDSAVVGMPKNLRKRNLADASKATVSENQSEGQSESIKDSNRPKRRQKVAAAAEPSVGQKRYNLRRSKRPTELVTDGSLPESRKGKKDAVQEGGNPSENIEFGEASREEIPEFGTAPVDRGYGVGDDHPARSAGVASAFSADSPFKSAGGIYDTENTSVDNMVLSEEEVNGTADEEFGSESREEDSDDNDDGDEVHPGEVSMRKKLWTFLTT